MKFPVYFSACVFMLMLFNQCIDEVHVERDFPQVKTLDVTKINADGVLFEAEIVYRGNAEVKEFGFLWSQKENPITEDYLGKVSMDGPYNEPYISYMVSAGLENEKLYHMRAYMITASHKIYGRTVSFTSLGGKTPSIESFFPESGKWDDTLTIRGKHLGFSVENLGIELGTHPCKVISAGDSLVRFVVPALPNDSVVHITFSLAGHEVTSAKPFRFKVPEITYVSPLVLTKPGEVITLYGKNFHPNIQHNNINTHGFTAHIVDFTPDSLKIQLPDEFIPNYHVSVFRNITLTLNSGGFDARKNTRLEWQSTWTQKKTFPGTGRAGAVVFTIGDNAYYGTGATGGYNSLNDFWKYTPENDNWQRIADFPNPERVFASAFALNNQGYVGLGRCFQTGDQFRDFFRLDPTDDSWHPVADFAPGTRYYATAFTSEGFAYAGTGRGRLNNIPNHLHNDLWRYDPTTNQWQEATPFPLATAYAQAFNHLGETFVYDGSELFKWGSNSWIKTVFTSLNRELYTIFSLNGKIYAGLGRELVGYTVMHQFIEYDPETGNIREVSLSPDQARYGASVFVLNNKAYLVGGFENRQGQHLGLRQVWEFDPTKPAL